MEDQQPMWSGVVQTAPVPSTAPLPVPPAPPANDPLYSDAPLGPELPPADEMVPAPMLKPEGYSPVEGKPISNIIINTGTAENPNNRMINIPLIPSTPAPRPEEMFGPAPPPGFKAKEAAVAPMTEPAEEKPAESPGTKLFLGGLNYDTEEQGLRAYFGKWGTVVDCLVLRDKDTEKSRGFGFVTLVEEEAVELVLNEPTHEIDGRNLTVRRATQRGTGPLQDDGQPKCALPQPPPPEHKCGPAPAGPGGQRMSPRPRPVLTHAGRPLAAPCAGSAPLARARKPESAETPTCARSAPRGTPSRWIPGCPPDPLR